MTFSASKSKRISLVSVIAICSLCAQMLNLMTAEIKQVTNKTHNIFQNLSNICSLIVVQMVSTRLNIFQQCSIILLQLNRGKSEEAPLKLDVGASPVYMRKDTNPRLCWMQSILLSIMFWCSHIQKKNPLTTILMCNKSGSIYQISTSILVQQ